MPSRDMYIMLSLSLSPTYGRRKEGGREGVKKLPAGTPLGTSDNIFWQPEDPNAEVWTGFLDDWDERIIRASLA